MSWKDSYIAKHEEEAYAKRLERRRSWERNYQAVRSSVLKREEMQIRNKHENMIELGMKKILKR